MAGVSALVPAPAVMMHGPALVQHSWPAGLLSGSWDPREMQLAGSCCDGGRHAGDSSKLITGSADSSARLWDLATGKSLHTFQFHEPCRAVAFSVGDGMAAISSDPFMGVPARIYLVQPPPPTAPPPPRAGPHPPGTFKHALPRASGQLNVGACSRLSGGQACHSSTVTVLGIKPV